MGNGSRELANELRRARAELPRLLLASRGVAAGVQTSGLLGGGSSLGAIGGAVGLVADAAGSLAQVDRAKKAAASLGGNLGLAWLDKKWRESDLPQSGDQMGWVTKVREFFGDVGAKERVSGRLSDLAEETARAGYTVDREWLQKFAPELVDEERRVKKARKRAEDVALDRYTFWEKAQKGGAARAGR